MDASAASGKGFLLVYSITDPNSFEEVSRVLSKILRIKDCDSVPMVLAGNKVRVRFLSTGPPSGPKASG
eukprot:scaffold903_cov262-Pinguiococcus_pyrenoidosus.AAC.17